MEVKAWYEKVTIPTYGIGKPEKNPIFLEKRVYQGSSGAVYPHPVIEKIEDEKKDVVWDAVFLENEYLKIMILPQLGGRVQMAYDKFKQRHFVYYNHVIKPALVGLTGPWISGGIEFNWPQHHRPSTYEPTDSKIEKNSDGSITVWCNELERMFRTRGMAGFTLHPDKAYLEIKVKLYNRTNHPQTFLWWANPAVAVNNEYQSVFPPDVNAVFDHGKRDVSEFPIAKGTYYKVDYSPGTDISRYKNIPVPTSYMAITSDYNFVGGYENDTKGGLLHVANHHISPGKKQWTWGNGDFGKAWDRNLTDTDGPYIELMCGVYTDNQPDFSWLMPGEEKSFKQYFMPYRDLGLVKNASKEAIVNLETTGRKTTIKAYTTSAYLKAKVILSSKNTIIFEQLFDFHPSTSYKKTIELPEGILGEELEIYIRDADGKTLIEWCASPIENREIPEPANAAQLPNEIESNEQLYLTGLHLEQYRHATYDPRPYYKEALQRDAKDTRCNNALGLWHLRRGQFSTAETYFQTAIETLTERNPNPIDGEAFFNLGITQRFLGKTQDAYKAFYKSVWNAAWMDSGYFELARIETSNKKWDDALDTIDRSLIRNWHHHKARQLKVSILRSLGQTEAALALIEESLKIDGFNYSLFFEKYLLNQNEEALSEMKRLIRGNIHNFIEFALDYSHAGLYNEAIEFIDIGIDMQKGNIYPLTLYYKAWFQSQIGNIEEAKITLGIAVQQNPDYCFPNQTESIIALESAINLQSNDYKAYYYLGNYWYAFRNYDAAIQCWEKSIAINNQFPTVQRNYALACFNILNDAKRAVSTLENAFQLDTNDARILMELDQLYKRLKYPLQFRIDLLEKYKTIVSERDDLYLELITLYNLTGKNHKAYKMLICRQFHPWEGGEGKVAEQYVFSLTEFAKEAIQKNDFTKAIDFLTNARQYPHNLGEGKLQGAQENELLYLLGIVHLKRNEYDLAKAFFEEASMGLSEVSGAMFYNDQQPDTIFFQGLAMKQLNKQIEAQKCFEMLIEYGEKHQNDQIKIDYFAVSLPDLLIWEDNLDARNNLLCRYLLALGYLGLGKNNDALILFSEIIKEDPAHPKAAKFINGLSKIN